MALQHLRSSTANKRPLPAGMSDGQLAINTNLASPGLFLKNSNGDLVKVGPVHVGTTAPNASPAAGGETGNTTGELWLDTSVTPNQLKTWNGSAWVSDFPDEIPVAKLADGAARQLLQTDAAGTGVEWTSNVDVPGTLDVTGAATFDSSVAVTGTLTKSGSNVVTVGDTGTVTSTMLLDGTIVNADVNASAAIAGTKISPDFGSQNVATTGTATAAALIPSGSSVPTNGVYLPSANNVAISTNGTGRLFVDASGNVGVGTSPSHRLHISGTGSVSSRTVATDAAGDASFFVQNDGAVLCGPLVYGSTKAAYGALGSNEAAFYSNRTITILADGGSGAIKFATGGNAERMRLDNSGRLGLGTSSPGAVLDVSGSGNIVRLGDGTNTFDVRFKGPNNWAVQLDTSTDKFNIQRNSSPLVTVASSGAVGIGSNNPQRKLVVSEGGAQGFEFYPGDGGGGNTLNHYNRSTAAFIDATTTADQHIWGRADGEKARIDSSGRLLVGTSSDFVRGNLQVIDGGGGEITIGRNDTTVTSGNDLGHIYFASNAGGTGNTCASIQCYADADQGSGDYPTRLVFSTTADGASSPTERLRISAKGRLSMVSTDGAANVFATTKTANSTDSLFVGKNSSNGAIDNGTDCILIRSNGNVVNTNNSYGAISDIKLKENIVDASSQWDDLKAIQVRNYNFKEGQTHTQIGVVAQEVELISPGLVTESPDKDDEGNDLGTVTKSVNYSVLYMKAVKALQEAMDRIETLEAKVAALEAN